MRGTLLGISILMLSSAVLAQTQDPNPRPRERSTFQILEQRLPEVLYREARFEDVIRFLGEYAQINIVVRWNTLADNGIERDHPVSIQARNLRLSQVLWLIMNEVGGPDLRLAYRASGSLLILSTAEDLGQEMVTKVYDVSDLLVRVRNADRSSGMDVAQGMQQAGQGGQGGYGGGGGLFGGNQQGGYGQGNQSQDQQGAEEVMQQLVDLIQQTIEPDSWRENGGLGTLLPFQRSLVVRNTILVHQLLGGYLTEDEVVGTR